jgi:hypothetical protein
VIVHLYDVYKNGLNRNGIHLHASDLLQTRVTLRSTKHTIFGSYRCHITYQQRGFRYTLRILRASLALTFYSEYKSLFVKRVKQPT